MLSVCLSEGSVHAENSPQTLPFLKVLAPVSCCFFPGAQEL